MMPTRSSPARRRRIHFAIAALCLTLSAIAVGLTVASIWWYAWWLGPRGRCINISSGRVSFIDARPMTPTGSPWTLARSRDRELHWWFASNDGGNGAMPFVSVPLWTFMAAFGVPGGFFWRRARRIAKPGCRTCGYDLSGLQPNSTCPECGS